MRRGLIRTGAWAAATAAAVSVSWFGVHRVLGDSSAKQPRALVLAVTVPTTPPPPPPPTSIGSAAQTPSATPTPTATPSAPHDSGRPHGSQAPSHTPSASASASEQVTSFVRPGGLIVVAMGATSAHLITATPDPGWSVHSWSEPTWLRVDFEQGGTDSVFYITWNGHPPTVQT
ncbi:hypothetical protein [Streptacidiphilus sp. PAMC 29251]